jgi:hypothetical protein
MMTVKHSAGKTDESPRQMRDSSIMVRKLPMRVLSGACLPFSVLPAASNLPARAKGDSALFLGCEGPNLQEIIVARAKIKTAGIKV